MRTFIRKHRGAIFVVLLGVGVLLRFLAAASGFTYDMESYEIVARAVIEHKTVYAETTRYNYGPLWFYVLAGLYKVSLLFPDAFFAFRYLVVGVLSAVDIGLFVLFSKMFSPAIALLYYFNPLSIITTGYYSQFDNAALLLGWISVWYISKKQKTFGLVLLGVSLILKHVFFFFPVWLALREITWKERVRTVGIPVLIFLASFIPFLRDGFQGIKENVFLYASFANAPLWHVLVPDGLTRIISPGFLFLTALTVGAILFRKTPLAVSMAWYGMVLVAFAPAISEQYFVLVLPLIALVPNIFFVTFLFAQTAFAVIMMLGGEVYIPGLEMRVDRQVFGMSAQVTLLLAGIAWALLGNGMRKLSGKYWAYILAVVLILLMLGVWIPAYKEDRIIYSIEQAIVQGDYETANRAYSETQVNPPFAGSRFWNKLTKSRYYVEYYRNFIKTRDLYQANPNTEEWKHIQQYLKKMPPNFMYQKEVEQMQKDAKLHITK